MNFVPIKGLMYEVYTGHHGQGFQDDMHRRPCAEMELNLVECYEAYGQVKAKDKCAAFIDDHYECSQKMMRNLRRVLMQVERQKQLAKGQRSWSERWGKAFPYDSYFTDTFNP